MNNTDTIAQIIIAQAAAFVSTKTDAELLDMLDLLEGQNDEADRMTRACIIDALSNRHNLNDALDTIAFAEVEFIGTSRETVELALTMAA